jgi:hypothetical protein
MPEGWRARRSLLLDSAYCAAAGILALALAAPFGRLFHVPTALPAAIGAATIVWAGALAYLAPGTGARLLLAAVAAEVAAFAAVQSRYVFTS